MKRSSGYQTKQKERILSLLRDCGDRHTTATEITLLLQQQGTPVGTATIYRYLEQLAEEGVLRKYILDEKSGACYQYVGDSHRCREHFHLKCLRCGKLFHVSCDYLSQLDEHIALHHGFQIDHTKTVLYGTCAECAEEIEVITKETAD